MTQNFIAWKKQAPDESCVSAIQSNLGLSTVTSRILVNRGFSSIEAAKDFLNVGHHHIRDPFLLKDMDKAVARILKAMTAKEKICVYGDYDVDGAVSTALLVRFFRAVGYPIDFYIPHRLTEGYSLNKEALSRLQANGVSLVITVDNGITSVDDVAHANSIGLDVIVTDHHKVATHLPAAHAIVNPQQLDCLYPHKGICGAGVAFKLLLALRQRLRESGWFAKLTEPNLKNDLDLLAIATVCDVVPLRDENRYFVTEGLRQLAHTRKPGLRALLAVSQVDRAPVASDLGFRLGPRINACGRLENAQLGVELLITEDDQEAKRLASLLDQLNSERRGIELDIVTEAVAEIEREGVHHNRSGYVLYRPDWHVGVVGIVASRIVDRFKKPVFVLTLSDDGFVKGSGRSIGSVNLVACLQSCQELLTKFGGHEAAAGVTLSEDLVSEFRDRFDHAVQDQVSGQDVSADVLVDDEMNLANVTPALFEEMAQLEPHGMGNRRPVFAFERCETADVRIVGEKHLKFSLKQDGCSLDAIAFNQAEMMPLLSGFFGVVSALELNHFNGRSRPQLNVRGFFKS